MRGELAAFFRGIERAPGDREVAFALMDQAPRLVGATATGFYSMLEGNRAREVHLRGVPRGVADYYEEHGRLADTLLQRVVQRHSAMLLNLDALRSEPAQMRDVIDRAMDVDRSRDIREYMVVPIVVGGGVAGTMHFASEGHLDPALGAAISVHVSARLAVLRALESLTAAWDGELTVREQEIGSLAARGLSTRQMGRAAGISENTVKKYLKQLYAKLGTSSRAELSSALLRGPHHYVRSRQRAAPQQRPLRTGLPAFWY